MKTIVGLFERYEDAERAIDALNQRGFSRSEISVAARDSALQRQLGGDTDQAVAESAGAGAVGGTAVGGLAGLLVGVGALALPGIGPVLAAGTLATVLGATAAGAGIGAAAGGLIGALVGLGIPEEDAQLYAEGVKRGGVLVTVHTTDERTPEAFRALHEAHALDIDTQRTSLRESGWSNFDDTTLPDENYPRLSGRARVY